MRITRFMQNSQGGHNIGLRVNGVEVLISASYSNQDAANALAEQVAALGPEYPPAPPPPTTNAAVSSSKPAPRNYLTPESIKVGQVVLCTVAHCGYYTITEIGTGRRRGEIKAVGKDSTGRQWLPLHNFKEA